MAPQSYVTGMGLSIVVRIARADGGQVDLSTQSGQGSCFSQCLPGDLARAQPITDRPT